MPKEATAASVKARDAILSAGKTCFASVGFDGASTRQIATMAGVTQGLLRYHFGSKHELWQAVMDSYFTAMAPDIAKTLNPAPGKTLAGQLIGTLRVLIRMCAADADFHRLMTIEARAPSNRLRWLVKTYVQDIFDTAIQLIRDGQRAGVVRDGDPVLLYYSAIAIAGTVYSQAPEMHLLTGTNTSPDPDDVERIITAALLVDPQEVPRG